MLTASQGLEYAEKSPLPERSRFRYTMGVAAPAVAWPTLYLPIEYGLTAQFAAFVGMYFVDSRACKRGWTPPWYGQYRFLLTAMVGLAMFISLVGRAEIEKSNRLSTEYLRTSMGRPGIADTETDWVKVEAEDKKKAKEEQEKKEKEAKKGKKQEKGGKDEKKGDEKDEKKPDDGEDGKKQEDSKDDKKGDEKDEKKDDKQDKDEKDDKKDEKKDDKDDKKDEKKDDKDTE